MTAPPQPPVPEPDPALSHTEAAVMAMIEERGLVGCTDPSFKRLYGARRRRAQLNQHLAEELHGRRYLIEDDVIPFLVLLALETGLEIECCKTLTVDCLRNPSGGTVEITYLKRRARGAEHKFWRARDGSPTTPGGLIRKLIELTAAAHRHHPSVSLWVYHGPRPRQILCRYSSSASNDRCLDASARHSRRCRASAPPRPVPPPQDPQGAVVSKERRSRRPLRGRSYAGGGRASLCRRAGLAAAARGDRR